MSEDIGTQRCQLVVPDEKVLDHPFFSIGTIKSADLDQWQYNRSPVAVDFKHQLPSGKHARLLLTAKGLHGALVCAMTDSVDLLMRRLQANDSVAAELVFRRYSEQLIGLAQQRLGWRLRRKFDPEDAVQSAFISFFRLQVRGELKFENWDALWGLLALLTIRKCGHRIEHYRAACRDIGRERSAQLNVADITASQPDWEAVSREPSPSEAAMLTETIAELLQMLDDRDRRIVTLALQGSTVQEISLEIGRSERTVQRVLERLKSELIRRSDSNADVS